MGLPRAGKRERGKMVPLESEQQAGGAEKRSGLSLGTLQVRAKKGRRDHRPEKGLLGFLWPRPLTGKLSCPPGSPVPSPPDKVAPVYRPEGWEN